ncbi:MAG: AMP-binding protein, partial [Methanomassiliicoccaceae archaeon]|nr:AMP-binding protein [Methanomassiliicoccaceae archaeon]
MNGGPWMRHYGNVPPSLDYPKGTLYDVLRDAAEGDGGRCAYEFMDSGTSYSELMDDIGTTASALKAMGVGKGDPVIICLPNIPQAVTVFYAVSRIGAVAAMVHPLSSRNEMEFYIKDSGSKIAVTMDRSCGIFEGLERTTPLERLVIVDISKDLRTLTRIGYRIRSRVPRPEMKDHMISWED